jgi:hypothetical protein
LGRRRPYWLVEAEGEQNGGDRPKRFEGPVPFVSNDFENRLATGEIQGRHWPEQLPDAIPAGGGGLRRYRLRYVWDANEPILAVISCNPSKATRLKLDETLVRTVNQASIWGCGGIDQCNLSPVYQSDSENLTPEMFEDDEENWLAIGRILRRDRVWISWGGVPGAQGLRMRWNVAVDRALGMIFERQRDGMEVVAGRLIGTSGYRPPAHPCPRSRGHRTFYERPLLVEVVPSSVLARCSRL